MHQALYITTLAAFFLLPPALLAARFLRPGIFPWWLVVLMILAGSWLLVNATVIFYYEYLGNLIENTTNPAPKLLDRWAADGAKRVFALYFGWLYGLVYSVPFFAVFLVMNGIRRRSRKRLADVS